MRAMIRFGKCSRLRFISHLDLQRFFQRALNRSGLPVAWSQGFNPHPIMSFGSALALGWTSEYEVLDVKLSVPMGRGRTEEAMRSALPEDLPVMEVRMADDRQPAPMALVRASDYRVRFHMEDMDAMRRAVELFMQRDEVMATRRTKSGEKEIDIRPLVLSLREEEDAFVVRTCLTEKNTLKPDLLFATAAGLAGLGIVPAGIHRLCLLGDDEAGGLRPLMELVR